MFTDNKDFYPTPQNLIDKMFDGLDWKMIHTILEPSAGKGNIVEALKKKEDFNNRWYTTIKLNYLLNLSKECGIDYLIRLNLKNKLKISLICLWI